MNIYLIRHAKAEPSFAGISDFDRELTKEGRASIRSAAENWHKLIHQFDHIVSSPLVRAVQTSKIIADVFEYKNEIIINKILNGSGRTDKLIEAANALDGEDIAFIGHQPDCSNHLAALISSDGSHFEFKTGTIAKISFHNRMQLSKGYLEFLIPPSILK